MLVQSHVINGIELLNGVDDTRANLIGARTCELIPREQGYERLGPISGRRGLRRRIESSLMVILLL